MSSQIERDTGGLIPVARYSSAGQRPEDRYSAWREGSLLSFGRMFDTEPLVPFSADTSMTQLGVIGFSHTRLTSQNWRRTSAHVRSDGADPLMVNVRFTGAGHGDANGRSFDAPPGCVVLSDFAQPQSYFSETSFNAVLAIPRAIAELRLPRVRDLHGLVISPKAAGFLRTYTLTLLEALNKGVHPHHGERLAKIALDLLADGVAQSTPEFTISGGLSELGARFAAEAAIERNLYNNELSVPEICKMTGISRTSLYRLFEPDGGVMAFMRQKRLAILARELAAGATESIAEFAFRFGFSDASHLSRAFKAQFGASPRDYQRMRQGRQA